MLTGRSPLANPNNNKNNNNRFKVRFGVQGRHRGPPFAKGHHQSMILMVNPDEGEGEGENTDRVGFPCIQPA